MTMKYCTDCGTGHECEAAQSPGTNPDVEIARINARRDVEVARLTAGMERDANETEVEVAAIEAESGVAEAEAVADALTEVLTPPDPEPQPPADPIIVTDVQDDDTSDELPPRDDRDHDSSGPGPRSPARKTGFF